MSVHFKLYILTKSNMMRRNYEVGIRKTGQNCLWERIHSTYWMQFFFNLSKQWFIYVHIQLNAYEKNTPFRHKKIILKCSMAFWLFFVWIRKKIEAEHISALKHRQNEFRIRTECSISRKRSVTWIHWQRYIWFWIQCCGCAHV